VSAKARDAKADAGALGAGAWNMTSRHADSRTGEAMNPIQGISLSAGPDASKTDLSALIFCRHARRRAIAQERRARQLSTFNIDGERAAPGGSFGCFERVRGHSRSERVFRNEFPFLPRRSGRAGDFSPC